MALLLFMTLAAWSMGSAVGSSNDEDFILTTIWCGSSGTTGATPYCRPDPDSPPYMIVPGLVAEPENCFAHVIAGNYASAACQNGLIEEEFSTDRYDRGVYPRGYPNVMRTFVEEDVEKSVLQMRLFNSFLAAILITMALSIKQRMTNDLQLTLLVVAAPLALFHIGSVHNSSWTFTGTACFILTFTAALRNRRSKKLWIPAALLTLLAIWLTISSRPEGKYTLVFLGGLILISEFPPKNLTLSKQNFLIMFGFLVIALMVYQRLPWFRSEEVFNGQRILPEKAFPHSANDLLLNNFLSLPSYFLSFFGSLGLGYPVLNLAPTIWLFSLLATLLLMSFAVHKSLKVHKVTFYFALSIMCLAILYLHQGQLYEINNEISPRYFMPLFIGIVMIASGNKKVRYPNSLVLAAAILSTISNSVAIRESIRRYVTGQDVYSFKSLNDGREWWWQFGPQPETVWLTGTLAFAALWALLIYDRNKNVVEATNSPAPELAN